MMSVIYIIKEGTETTRPPGAGADAGPAARDADGDGDARHDCPLPDRLSALLLACAGPCPCAPKAVRPAAPPGAPPFACPRPGPCGQETNPESIGSARAIPRTTNSRQRVTSSPQRATNFMLVVSGVKSLKREFELVRRFVRARIAQQRLALGQPQRRSHLTPGG